MCLSLWIKVKDLSQIGATYTWNNKQLGDQLVYSRIDRVMVNEEFILAIPTSYVDFQPEGWLDHCPAVIYLGTHHQRKGNKHFKFFDMWGSHDRFPDIVSWNCPISGSRMYVVVKKLKMGFKTLNRSDYADIELKYMRMKEELTQVQQLIHQDYSNMSLREKESVILVSDYQKRLLFLHSAES